MTPYEKLDDKLRGLVDLVRALFDERPIWTRRAVRNRIHQEHFLLIGKYAYQYVGYMFSSGPWRDSVVKYGIDPRMDSMYRFYQTLVFKMKDPARAPRVAQRPVSQAYLGPARGGARSTVNVPAGTSHIFDGTAVSSEGRTWQVCDVTDPPLKRALATRNLRSKCDVSLCSAVTSLLNYVQIYGDGWYHNGTWALVRAVMRVKIDHIIDGKGVLPESDYAPVLTMPEMVDSSNKHLTTIQFPYKASGKDKFQMELLALFRTSLNEPESEPLHRGQPKKVVVDQDAERIEEEEDEEDDELVNPRLRDMRIELDKLEKNGESLGSIEPNVDLGQDKDDNDEENELADLLKEGINGREEEDSGSASTELDGESDGSSEGEAMEYG